jgi:hypothetical protein
MKTTPAILAIASVALLSGCSTPTILRVQAGPDPFAAKAGSPDGNLQVFSQTETEENVGFGFPYYQRTDYDIYDVNGNRIKHVYGNNTGNFDPTPRTIRLSPGTYSVKAMAAVGVGQWVVVPVLIEP